MKVEPKSYRDDANNIVDDIAIENSFFKRIVVLRDSDGKLTVRGKTVEGYTVEEQFTRTSRQYTGIAHDGEVTDTVHEDIKDALHSVGYAVEPPQLVRESEGFKVGTQTDHKGENNE